jgi:hypothetical protein
MSSWGNNDNAANAPYWAVNSTIAPDNPNRARPTAANVAILYGNTTPDVYTTGKTIGLFMVDYNEQFFGADKVVDVSIIQGGTGYVEAPGVTFSGGGGSSAAATASIAGGVVTKIMVTNTGSSYETVPDVTIQVPVMTVTASSVNISLDTINYAAHGQANSAALVYNNGGGTTLAGLTSGTTYYVTNPITNSFKLATSAANAANNVSINLTGQGNNAQFFTIVAGVRATSVADKGLGAQGDFANTGFTHAAHTGWNLKTVGSGGRAGRVQWETLVVTANTVPAYDTDSTDNLPLPGA